MKRFFVAACLLVFVVTSVRASDTMSMPKKKSPVLAAVCSMVLTGAGQAYNEQYKKGGILLGTNILGWSLFIGGLAGSVEVNEEDDLEVSEDNLGLAGLGILMALGSSLYSIVDAPISANSINKRHQQKTHLFQRDGERFTVGVDPITSRKRVGTMLSLRF